MKFNERWIREWIDPPIDTETFAARLTAVGLEVESVAPVAGTMKHVAVAKIVGVAPHPGAATLRLCEVDDGSGVTRRVVCAAPNVRPGMRSALARAGASLPDGSKVHEGRIRGELSQGMLCSERELGLGEDSDGIIELDADAPAGADLAQWLGLDDVTIEVGVTPNRGDCLCIAGLAREIAVASRLATKRSGQAAPVAPEVGDAMPVALDAPERCPRYVGRVIRGIDPTARSPRWMKERLRRCGVRPLSAVVDITSYVMLEIGQPMHAFDHARLNSGIRVRNGRAGETLTLLDDTVIELDADALVIADESRPVALAGIMGGLDSAVTSATRDVFLESAWFEPRTIALEARRRGMQTDASRRFERTVAWDGQRNAMERATALLVAIAGGEPGPVVEAVDDAHLPRVEPIALRRDRIGRVLGTTIPAQDVRDILVRLDMRVEETATGWNVIPPAHRPDVGIEIDLIEEVARIVGFENLHGTAPAARLEFAARPESRVDVERIRGRLVERGYHEAITYSFVDAALQARIEPALGGVELANPIASDMGVMRTTLWPGLIGAAIYNVHRQQSRVRLFEIGRVFVADGDDIRQPSRIGAIAAGLAVPEQWALDARAVDFYDVKGDVEALFALSGQTVEFIGDTHPALHPGQTAAIVRGDERIGTVGSLHPSLASDLKLPAAVLLQLDLESVTEGVLPRFSALSKYPAVRRDLSLLLPAAVPSNEVRNCVLQAGVDDLESVALFDVYRGEGIDLGMKSISLALTFQSRSRTLGDTEVSVALGKILNSLSTKLRAVPRG